MPEPKSVLIVDDSATVRQLLRFGLARVPNTHCEEAGDGAQALQLLDKKRYDLILCDINMPVMDGFTLVGEIRRRPTFKDIPIVMITTEGSAEDQRRAMDAGATAYLTKPVQVPKFLEVVQRFLK